MSNTPETDAAVISSNGQWSFVLKETCRRIERERDEAREEINIIGNTLSQNGEAVGNGEHDFSIIEIIKNLIQSRGYFRRKSDSLERERDEARKKYDTLATEHMLVVNKLCEERDEAREVIRNIVWAGRVGRQWQNYAIEFLEKLEKVK